MSRDPNRLYKLYDEIRVLHMTEFPDWRFGQFMYNFFFWLKGTKDSDGFYYEEDEILDLFKEFIDFVKINERESR